VLDWTYPLCWLRWGRWTPRSGLLHRRQCYPLHSLCRWLWQLNLHIHGFRQFIVLTTHGDLCFIWRLARTETETLRLIVCLSVASHLGFGLKFGAFPNILSSCKRAGLVLAWGIDKDLVLGALSPKLLEGLERSGRSLLNTLLSEGNHRQGRYVVDTSFLLAFFYWFVLSYEHHTLMVSIVNKVELRLHRCSLGTTLECICSSLTDIIQLLH
jgi:hypothetical protein